MRSSKGEAKVQYDINPGRPYTIADIRYDIQDSLLYGLVMIDTANCTIERGMIYDVDLLQRERLRLERFIRDRGFYTFSTENIYFRIDSALMNRQIIVQYVVSRRTTFDRQGRPVYSNHQMYRVRDIYVFPDFDPRLALTEGEAYTSNFDTTFFNGIHFIAPPGRMLVKPEVLAQALYVTPGSLFSLTNVDADGVAPYRS